MKFRYLQDVDEKFLSIICFLQIPFSCLNSLFISICLIIHLFITFLKIHVPFYYKIIVLALVGYNESKTVSVAEQL